MTALESHPLRITDRDLLKEVSQDEWFTSFKGLDLHIRVLGARDLSPKARAGLPDPYCKILCGQAQHRTATQRRTLDPDWGEEFYLEWHEVSAGKRQVLVEVWDWDFWRPDELLGRGFVDINALAFEPQEVLELDLKLHPANIRKLKDVKPPTQQQPKKQHGKQDAQQQQPQSQLQRALSHPLLTQPSLRHYLQEKRGGNKQQQQPKQQHPQQQPPQQQQLQPQQPELGTVRVALWWAPTWRHHHAFDVAERVSFCLLPGEIKVPPVVTHAKLGTLYEEPCIVYIKLSLLEVQLGSSWYLQYLKQASKSSPKTARHTQQQLHRSLSSASMSDWHDVNNTVTNSSNIGGGLDMADSLEAAVAAVVSAYHQDAGGAQASNRLFDFLGGSSFSDSPSMAEEARVQQQQQALLQQHLAAEPVYALARLRFGKHQVHESNPVRLRPGGAAVFREQFVFTSKRPLQHKRLVLEVVLRGKALPGGKLMARGEWSVVDLLLASPPPPTTWLGVRAFRRNQLPGIELSLQGIEGGTVELRAAAADADGRAAIVTMFGTAAGEGEGGGVRASALVVTAGQQQQHGWLGWLQQQLPWPLGGSTTSSSSSQAAGTPRLNPFTARLQKPSPFARSPSASLLAAGGGSSSSAAATPKAAAAAAATAAAAAAADIVSSSVSPIPGLPVQPERGCLAGPLATLQLVVHRVELTPEPPKGWWLLLKIGPHWAKSAVRRESDFAWQLSVPIYHPTTTLLLAVFTDAGRGKLQCLGKLTYRISYLMYLNHSHLMYLNHREVIKSLKLRVTGSSSIQQQQQHADSPHPPVVTPGVSVSHTTGLVLLGFTCSIPDRQRLLNAYERSQYPPTVHHISLFHAASRDLITQSHHQKVVAWLSAAADPPVPPAAAWKVLETGREKFRLSRSRHNIHRLRVATSWVPSAWNYFNDLKAWSRPSHNLASVAVMAALCFRPIASLFAFLLWRSVVALRRLLMHGLVEYLGFDLGELFDTAGLLPSDLLYYEDDEDDDAASTSSGGSASSSVFGPYNAAGGGSSGGGWGGGGGGVRDLAAIMMFQPRRLKMLKRRYEQLLRISLQVQNRIDDLAMVFERLQAMVTGQDPLATALFFWRSLLLAAALWLAGPGVLLFGWWCWEVLRPPWWRKAPGVKGPVQFVSNLPSKSLEELRASAIKSRSYSIVGKTAPKAALWGPAEISQSSTIAGG
ncbi:hypothetical protein OEZ85_005670 [Tetradesmus obliquus]|uniref:C2 domain-containing protein n=1 Tax=Tetradesmus obliquus TaxID=3088 RepID=A0ABY8UEG1_TETOB|nr:hypothetical protein OEZ85_005670 [Tetradesmus obliquus]